MPWLYTPASVRLVPPTELWNAQSLSAIYLARVENGAVTTDMCLTVCHVPRSDLARHKVYVLALHLSSGDGVAWQVATVADAVPLFADDPLLAYVKHALSAGFNYIPCDTLVGNPVEAVCLVRLLCRLLYSSATAAHFEPFCVGRTDAPSGLVVRSHPFSFTSPKLFADFRLAGSTAMVLRDGSAVCGYVSDVKYLENMAGAPVFSTTGTSLGLVAGNLRKLNGDGDLVLVVPWERLLPLVLDAPPATSLEIVVSGPSVPSGVLPLVLSRGTAPCSWGSCVLLNRHTLVTNQHVVKPYLDSDDVLCLVLARGVHVPLLREDIVVVPFEGLDLAFVSLSEENQLRLAGVEPVKFTFSSKISPAELVYTAGYGLLLNQDNIVPLMSQGHVSTKVNCQPFEFSRNIPCLIISSSSCWNGSSGGGVFDSRGNFFGLICSNAQVFVPSVTGEAPDKTEKIPQFCLSIPLELILECYRVKIVEKSDSVVLSEKVEKTWRLEAYEEDTFERAVKL